MRRQVAIRGSKCAEAGIQQRKVFCFFFTDADSVIIEIPREIGVGEAGNHIPREIDRIQFDMRDRVN